MKKQKLTLLVMILFLAGATMCSRGEKETSSLNAVNSSVYSSSIDLSQDNVTLTNNNGTASFRCSSLSREIGEPMLPVISHTFVLPADCDLSIVETEIENLSEVELEGSFDVEAAQPATVDGKIVWPDDSKYVNGKNIEVYEKNALYPDKNNAAFTTGMLRECKLVEVKVFPYRYNPVTKKLSKLTGGTLVVKSARPENSLYATKSISKSVASKKLSILAANASELTKFYSESSSSSLFNYVIITTDEIVSASTQLANFVSHKEALGYSVLVATESTWGGGTGDTAAENIRAWLKSEYLTLGIDYVLLIGNPNPTSGAVPMKMAYPRNSATSDKDAPTDFYYAELTGNWDLDGDGYYGEESGDRSTGGADTYAEVSVGRIPYYGVISDTDAILAKTIAYEDSTDVAWRSKVLMPMIPSDDSTPGYQLGEQIKTEILSMNNYGYNRIYGSDITSINSSIVPETYGNFCTTYSDITSTQKYDYSKTVAAMNSDYFGYMVWWTHGGPTNTYCVLNTSSVASLSDDAANHPVFTFQCSCSNSYPESSTNLSYTLLKRGGINTISATRSSWYYVGQTSFANSTSNSGIAYQYSKNLITGKMSGSDALNQTRSDLGFTSLWVNCLVFNVYGDPSVKLSAAKSGDPVLSFAQSSIDLGTISDAVTVTNLYTNIGGGTLSVNYAASSETWATATAYLGRVSVKVDPSNLTKGETYSTTIALSTNGGTQSFVITFTYADDYETNLGSGSTLYLAGESFGSWSAGNSTYALSLVNDYTWEATVTVTSALTDTPYKITLNGTWDVNWGGGATGKTTTLSRDGDNATVSLSAGEYTLRVTETGDSSYPLSVKWINNSTPDTLTIHFNEWESATSYILHAWNGLSGDYTMTYEGYINGKYWWVIELTDIPESFNFTFTNTNGSWEGSSSYDRSYTGQSDEIYILPYSSTIYTSRP